MKSKAIVFRSPYDVKIDHFELPGLKNGQILTRTLLSGVSTGTEKRVLAGKQDGVSFPLIPGYENMGVVEEIYQSSEFNIGDRIFVGKSESTGKFNKAWGGHLQYAVADVNSVVRIPDNVSDDEAVFTKIGAISLHGVKRAEIKLDEKIVVVGLGLIGSLAALCAKAFGAVVIGVDTVQERLESIKSKIDHIVSADNNDLQKSIYEITGKGADVVIDATGNPDLADSSARLLKGKDWDDLYHPSGRFVLLGSIIGDVKFNYNDTLFMNEIDIRTSRDTVKEDLEEMLELIKDKRVDTSVLPQKIYKYYDAPKAYNDLFEENMMRIVFDWREL